MKVRMALNPHEVPHGALTPVPFSCTSSQFIPTATLFGRILGKPCIRWVMDRHVSSACFPRWKLFSFHSVSPLSLQPNGVECPTCYSELGTCRPVSLKCTGAQTTCVNVTGQGMIIPSNVLLRAQQAIHHYVVNYAKCSNWKTVNIYYISECVNL